MTHVLYNKIFRRVRNYEFEHNVIHFLPHLVVAICWVLFVWFAIFALSLPVLMSDRFQLCKPLVNVHLCVVVSV